MFLRFLYTVIIIFHTGVCLSQSQSIIDSLKIELENAGEGKGRIDLHNLLIEQYHKTDSTNATIHWQKAKELATQLEYTKGLAEAHYNYANMLMRHGHNDQAEIWYLNSITTISLLEGNQPHVAKSLNGLGISNYYLGDYEKAKDYHLEALDMLRVIDDLDVRAQSWHSLANTMYRQGNLDSARHYYDLAMEIYVSLNDPSKIALCLNNIGNIYNSQSNYPKALEYYFKTLEIDQNLKDSLSIAMDFGNIGNVYNDLGDSKLALDYHFKSLKIKETRSSKLSLLYSYYNIGWIYSELSNYDSAKIYYEKCYDFSKQLSNQAMLSYSSSGLGEVYLNFGEYDKANFYLQEAATLRKRMGERLEWVQSVALLGRVAFKQGEHQKSKAFLEDAMAVAREVGSPREIRVVAEYATELFSSISDYKSAYEYHVLYKTMDDSLRNEDNIRQIALLEADYRFEQEKQQIAAENRANLLLEQQKLTVQRYYTLAAIGGLTTFLLISFFIYRNYRQKRQANVLLEKQNRQINEQAQDLEEKNKKLLELDQFKQDMTSMVVHDLKNPLSVIIQKGEQKTVSIARKMLNLVLNILDVQKFEETEVELNREKIKLSQLIERAISEVQESLEEKNLTINTVGEDFEVETDVELMERVIINLLTNAIKYSPLNSILKIEISKTDDELIEFKLTDKGPGIPLEKHAIIFDRYIQADKKHSTRVQSTGLGLAFCKLVIEAHNGKIGVVSKDGTGTTFWFTLGFSSQADQLNISAPQSNTQLSNKEKEMLMSISDQLKRLKIYESTEIENLLQSLNPEESSGLNNYSEKLINASYNGNHEVYEKLLKTLHSKSIT